MEYDSDYGLRRILYEPGHPLHDELQGFLASLPIDALTASTKRDLKARGCIPPARDLAHAEHLIRVFLAERLVSVEVQIRRRDLLARQKTLELPAPYDHPDLRGVAVDAERLVSVDDFDQWHGGAYARGRTVFQLVPSLFWASNSVYWAHIILQQLPRDVSVRVRLDPLMRADREGYMGPFFAMRAWGQPLDWSRLHTLRDGQVDQGRWYPDEGAETDLAQTDWVWDRAGDELRFVCEEVPTAEASAFRASRYLHSVYDLRTETFSHVDGAVRLFGPHEIGTRITEHVRKSGKAGCRIKVFRADGPIPRDQWCALAASFFVWNDEVRAYFNDGSP